MCGIAGILTREDLRPEELDGAVDRMSRCMTHRGPDDSGTWSDAESGIAFGFRRLSIIDTSGAGHQPMVSASGRFTIVFNGEVYNFVEIRAELERLGVAFRGHSDTEVILAAFERWEIEPAISRFIGMFAMAVWDARGRTLTLVRDRLGIKPLYYYHRPGLVTFASELKGLAAGPEFDRTIDHGALSAYLRYLYVPAPLTIYRSAKKLRPGHILTIADAGLLPPARTYWSIEAVQAAGARDPFIGDDDDAVAELQRVLSDAVRLRMRSDVPMGALLSGGVDSSTVVALMQSHATRPTRTFSIGFPGTSHDEAEHARGVASALGTDHTELSVSGDEALAVVPRLPEIFDEPFADPSQIPTFLVCQLAREDVTVALSGDGGDEVFAGYERYLQGERVIGALRRVPRVVRKVAGAGVLASSADFWEQAYRSVAPIVDGKGRHRLAGEKMRKLGNLLGRESDAEMYKSLLSAGWQQPTEALARGTEIRTRIEEQLDLHRALPLLDRMMLVDQQVYLADDLLAKVDRASMAVSLEARVPLLDHRVVEFSWRLRREFKVRDGRGKWVLRQLLHRYISRDHVERPKVGFTAPIAAWLRGPVRTWAEDLLFGSERMDAWLSPAGVGRAWQRLQNGGDDVANSVWAVVMFQAWRQRWMS
jgi:asparagine synthase (glutamine-hydrolysing)